MSNVIVQSVKGLMNNAEIKKKFADMLGERVQGFFVSVSNCVSNNDLLQKADANSVIMAAAVAASLDLPIDPNLGFAYIVPYNNKVKGTNGQPDTWKTVAQFQLGYRGLIQLSQRSGQFKTINVSDVREGEIEMEDFLTGEITFAWLPRAERLKLPVIGYVAYFRLLNGFEKSFYMSKEEADAHGKKYSQTSKKGYGLWKDDFDSMAKKTVVKMLLSKFAPLSIQMQRAVIADQGVVKDVNNDAIDVDYVDNAPDSLNIANIESEKQAERIAEHILKA
ncbi:recombinase RecT [Dyadobacter flavalbus]|uniref:Recombinase RecT n=1 Tax=Dyadobacter flavalbus TaxID=2579942 RepID=A0A5M8QXW1_9BACT|nr:recombinase RecT [Dyadobacter flavalbus]KAA6438842.1 recombinase RecT [Dyadobacter flavalbus]